MLSYKTQGLVGWLGAGVPPTLGTQALLKSKRYWRMNVVSCNLVRSSWMATSLLTQCLFQGWALGARSTSAMCPCVNRGFGTAHPNKTEFKADLDLTPPLPSRRIETTLFCTYTGRHVYTLCLQRNFIGQNPRRPKHQRCCINSSQTAGWPWSLLGWPCLASLLSAAFSSRLGFTPHGGPREVIQG